MARRTRGAQAPKDDISLRERLQSRVKPQGVSGPDGVTYTAEVNTQLNELSAGTFSQGAGVRFLQYLESITTRRVLGPTASNKELRHLEGARWLVGVIRSRMAAAKTQKDGR